MRYMEALTAAFSASDDEKIAIAGVISSKFENESFRSADLSDEPEDRISATILASSDEPALPVQMSETIAEASSLLMRSNVDVSRELIKELLLGTSKVIIGSASVESSEAEPIWDARTYRNGIGFSAPAYAPDSAPNAM